MLNVEVVIYTINNVGNQYFRLVLVIEPELTSKSALIKQVQDLLGATSIKIGAQISQQLLEMTERQRTLRLPRLLDDILTPYPPEQLVVLDNIEILFDQSLALNPLSMLQKLSRNRTIIAFWDGAINDGWLTYAIPGHPEYRRYPAQDVIVLTSGS